MKYALVSRKKAVEAGFSDVLHKVTFSGMVLNENELRKVNADDIESAAKLLGGERVMSLAEIQQSLKKVL